MCVCAPHCCGPTVIFYRPSCAQKRRRRKRTRAVLTPKVLLPTTTTTTTTNPYVPTYITSIQLLLLLLPLTTYMATLWFLFSFPSAGWMFIFRPHAQRSLLWAFSSPSPHSSLLGDLPWTKSEPELSWDCSLLSMKRRRAGRPALCVAILFFFIQEEEEEEENCAARIFFK